MHRLLRPSLLLLLLFSVGPARAATVLEADFDSGTDGFTYLDDAFLGTNEPAYASGVRVDPGGFSGGGLAVDLGGIDEADITDMSGGWEASFSVSEDAELELSFRFDITLTGDYESNEFGQVRVTLDGVPVGNGVSDDVTQFDGKGIGGAPIGSGWVLWRKNLGTLASGTYTLRIGGYNNQKTATSEATEVLIDDVRVGTPLPRESPAVALVDSLDFDRFKSNVATLAGFGSRHWIQPGNNDSGNWIQARLESYGYTVERHTYTFSGQPRDNIYATKIGSVNPDQMYIVSSHMDSVNIESPASVFAPGADDDASGTSLVLEAARVFGQSWVRTNDSVRFILWNNEETGLHGSSAYVSDRRTLQGVENPPGMWEEPSWLGVIQHDMIMWDHGPSPAVMSDQIAEADIDIEYQTTATFADEALALANAALSANASYATDYPAEIGSNMNNTDSKPFQDDTAAISIRENRRIEEIGYGYNPNRHRDTDVPETYSDDDYRLGFNAAQTTVATVALLAGAEIVPAPAVPTGSAGLRWLLGLLVLASGATLLARRSSRPGY